MTNNRHGQVPEALLHASYLDSIFVSEEVPASRAGRIAKELRRLHAENEALRTQQPAPCATCASLARAVMLDQTSFDRKPDCYGIRQITDDEGVEEWEDIRTSPDVAREEANDMMATGRGEIYEVVPLWTTPQPAPATQPAPQQEAQEPVAWYVTGCCRLLDEDEAKAEARRIGGTARAIPLYTVPHADNQPAPVPDMTVMQLAESVGLIGPASRTHDLHAAIQRFHDLICANATIKAAQMAAEAIDAARAAQEGSSNGLKT